MKILIADDEPLARHRLCDLLAQLRAQEGTPFELVAEVGDGIAAVAAATEHKPDVALLDIRMPGLDGIQAALQMGHLQPAPAVVFVTAFDEHALAAFDANAIDYLLKPVRVERLGAALDRARLLSQAQREALAADGEALSVTYRGALRRIPLSEVICLRAEQKYVGLIYREGEALLDESLKSIEERYPGRFLRVHRNALVAPGYVHELSRGDDGQTLLSLVGTDQRLEVSRRHLAEVRRALKGEFG